MDHLYLPDVHLGTSTKDAIDLLHQTLDLVVPWPYGDMAKCGALTNKYLTKAIERGHTKSGFTT